MFDNIVKNTTLSYCGCAFQIDMFYSNPNEPKARKFRVSLVGFLSFPVKVKTWEYRGEKHSSLHSKMTLDAKFMQEIQNKCLEMIYEDAISPSPLSLNVF